MEMQCHWFAYESGLAHMQLNEPGKALKRFYQIEKVLPLERDLIDRHLLTCMTTSLTFTRTPFAK